VRQQGGRLFIPRKSWERLDHETVYLCVHDLGVTISASD
jgi:hypothetical protein